MVPERFQDFQETGCWAEYQRRSSIEATVRHRFNKVVYIFIKLLTNTAIGSP